MRSTIWELLKSFQIMQIKGVRLLIREVIKTFWIIAPPFILIRHIIDVVDAFAGHRLKPDFSRLVVDVSRDNIFHQFPCTAILDDDPFAFGMCIRPAPGDSGFCCGGIGSDLDDGADIAERVSVPKLLPMQGR